MGKNGRQHQPRANTTQHGGTDTAPHATATSNVGSAPLEHASHAGKKRRSHAHANTPTETTTATAPKTTPRRHVRTTRSAISVVVLLLCTTPPRHRATSAAGRRHGHALTRCLRSTGRRHDAHRGATHAPHTGSTARTRRSIHPPGLPRGSIGQRVRRPPRASPSTASSNAEPATRGWSTTPLAAGHSVQGPAYGRAAVWRPGPQGGASRGRVQPREAAVPEYRRCYALRAKGGSPPPPSRSTGRGRGAPCRMSAPFPRNRSCPSGKTPAGPRRPA
jgi:hypothetical protein